MSFNIELWNKCQKCKHLERKPYLQKDEIVYTYVCAYKISVGQIKCNKFKAK